jgi:pyruvate kinase
MRGNEVEMRKTKIICTIGPACEGEERLRELMLAGMNVARFNFSHGSHEEHKVKFERVNKISGELGLPVATLLDTKGPEIRLKTIENGRTELTRGQKFALTTEEVIGNSERVSITYKNLKNDVSVGTTILIDDGLIEMVVDEIDETDIICTVVNGGPISNNKGVNVPGASLSMPYISDVDRSDIMFGCDMGFDYLAASFVRCREDILEVRGILKECGSNMKIIAKIENMQGIRNLDEILEASDGIMVARGDMGVEIPMEEVPVVQKRMIKKAEALGKHVITATQMLESMIKNPRPTRAETTDIANAIYDGTTAIMLSGESAAGLYPVEAVRTMARIAERTEQDINYRGRMKSRTEIDTMDITTAISHATCTTAMDLQAAAIITVTISGFTAGMIAKYKPQCPIIACSVSPGICRQLNLYWGVTPVWIKRENCAEDLFEKAVHAAEEAGYIKKGDRVVLTAGVPLGVSGNTNMIRVVEV